MASFRIKQIGLALSLMISLLISHASACACPHNSEKDATELSCHDGAAEKGDDIEGGNALDTSCVCVVEQPTPYAATKSSRKGFRPTDELSKGLEAAQGVQFAAIKLYTASPPQFASRISYSDALRSLLPARAPPRL